jgi:hypothetical protein
MNCKKQKRGFAQDSALLDAGLDFALGERMTAGVSYTGQYSDSVTDNNSVH